MIITIILLLIAVVVFGYAAYHAVGFLGDIYTTGQGFIGTRPKKKNKKKKK